MGSEYHLRSVEALVLVLAPSHPHVCSWFPTLFYLVLMVPLFFYLMIIDPYNFQLCLFFSLGDY